MAVAGSALSLFWPGSLAFGLPGVLGQYWQDEFGVGRGATGAVMFFMLASLGIFMFLVGRWQERLGPRVMLSIGGAVTGLSLFILPFAGTMSIVYLWAFIVGSASCFVMIPALTVVQRWYPSRRGLVSGIVNLTFALAGAIMAPLFALMLNSFGYDVLVVTIGILALASGLLVAQLVGLPTADAARAAARASAPHRPVPIRSLTVGQSVRARSFWLIWLIWALQGAAGIALVTLAVGFGEAQGFAFESAVIILTAFNITNGLSRIITGYFSDRINRTLTMGITFLAAGTAYFLMPHVAALGGIAVLAAVVGFGFGTLFSVSAPLAVDCFGIGHFGAVYGLIFTAYGFVAGVLGPLVGGALADTAGGYELVFSYLGALCLVSAVLVLFVKPPTLAVDPSPAA
jgi:OFA family oxalate/formate antiporter-like MFS transporter